jgi:hypothetical protein
MAGVFLCEAWLNKAWTEVNHARANRDYDRHLAKGTSANAQPVGAKCPSNEPFGVCCPCVDENPSSEMSPRIGAGLLMVPANLSLNTLREMHLQLDNDNPRIKMHILYQLTPPRGKTNQCISIGPTNDPTPVTDFAASDEDIKFLQNNPDSPDLAQYLVLCSRESWNTKVHRKGLSAIRYSRFFRDEFHQESSQNTKWIQYLKSLNESHRDAWDRPFGWLASGTPFEKGPESLVGAMSLLMHWYDWTDHRFWSKYTPVKLRKLQNELKAYINSDPVTEETDDATAPSDQKVREWNTLLKNLMIQRGRGCMWFDQHIMPLPRVRFRTVKVQNTSLMTKVANQAHTSLTDEETEKIQRPTDLVKSSIYNLCRACATFPKLSMKKYRNWPVKDNKGNLKKEVNLTTVNGLVAAGLFKKENMLDPKKNPFLADLKSIINFSVKMVHFRTIIDQMGFDYRGDPGQGIYFTYSNLSAMVLFLVSQL